MKELIHFTATWCQPCKQMQPVIERFLGKNPDITYTKFDADEHIAKFQEYGITGVPAFIGRVDGKLHDQHKGVATEFKLESLFG